MDQIRAMIADMAAIGAIVTEMYDTPDQMADALAQFAEQGNHDLGWVLKKAHEAMLGVEWDRHHAPLNERLGFESDYEG